MISMVMGYDHRINIADIPPLRCKLLFGLNPVDARINQQLYAACFHVDTVAIAAGLK